MDNSEHSLTVAVYDHWYSFIVYYMYKYSLQWMDFGLSPAISYNETLAYVQ